MKSSGIFRKLVWRLTCSGSRSSGIGAHILVQLHLVFSTVQDATLDHVVSGGFMATVKAHPGEPGLGLPINLPSVNELTLTF